MHFMHHDQVQIVMDQIKRAIRYCLKCIQC
jgi:hypothetical protein